MPVSSKKIFFHACISLLIIIAFLFILKWVISDWKRTELIALDRLRPETFKHLCQPNSLHNLKIYETYFKRVEKLMGNRFPEIYGLNGYLLAQKGSYDKAIEQYKKALNFKPDFFPYYYNLGTMYYLQGLYIESIAYLQKAIDIDITPSIAMIVESSKLYIPMITDCIGGMDQLAGRLQSAKIDSIDLVLLMQMKIKGEYQPINFKKPSFICF